MLGVGEYHVLIRKGGGYEVTRQRLGLVMDEGVKIYDLYLLPPPFGFGFIQDLFICFDFIIFYSYSVYW